MRFRSRIRKVNTSGIISTFAGNGVASFSGDGGLATAAELNNPTGITFDGVGNLYISDWGNFCVRKINTSGIISTLAGNGNTGYSGDGGQATAAELDSPMGITFDVIGNLYIADRDNQRIREVCFSSCTTAGIEQFANNNEQVSIYPNPTKNVLNVECLMVNANNALIMTDMLGNTIYHSTFTTQHNTIPVADIEAGVYFITVTSGASVSTQKVIVSK
jgi:hypothetical protein